MPLDRSRRRQGARLAGLGALLLALLVAAVGPAAPARALSSTVVISQVYGGGGNSGAPFRNDFVELFNRGATTVSLAGWSVQYASATGTTWQATALAGSLAPGQYYLVQLAAGTNAAAALPTPDTSDTTAMSASAGKVALVSSTAALSGACPAGAVDLVGYGGTAGCFEGAGPTPAPSNTNAVLRAGDGCTETDTNSADFAAGAPTPRNSAAPLAPCASGDPAITAQPQSQGVTPGGSATLSVVASGTGPLSYQWYQGASGATATPVGANSPSYTTPALSATTSYWVRVTNGLGASVDSQTATVSVGALCLAADTPIGQVQGTGASSPSAGASVTVQGVVVGDYEGPSPALGGFYLQDAGDGSAASSDGIFVASGGADTVALGQVVQVSGSVGEFTFGSSGGSETRISAAAVEGCGSSAAVTPADLTLPLASATALEAYEGMLVRFPQALAVTEHFLLGRFGQIVVSSGGRLPQPTNITTPGAAANAQQAANDLNKLYVDDDSQGQNPDPIQLGRGGQPLSAANTLRGGDTVTGMVGVIGQTDATDSTSVGATTDPVRYRLRPIGALGGGAPNFTPANPRPAAAPAVGGSLKVSAFNVLNYFLTLDVGTQANCGPLGAKQQCRGAETATELTRQQQKLTAALVAIDADVLGLIELENSQDASGAPVPVLEDLVGRLNAATAPGTYAFVNTGIIGTDAIRVGIVYKPAKVTPVGGFLIDSDPVHSRPPLAQRFAEVASGAQFTLVVNHFKSKGSCPAASDPNADQGDGQGCWNPLRVEQAQALLAFINGSLAPADPDVLVVGDLNSYAKEDPIRTLEQARLVNLIARFGGAGAYSYAFDGQWGYLDHALASASLNSQVVDSAEYHINADEPSILDYNTNFKSAGQLSGLFAPDAFRTSDHDPVVVGLSLTQSNRAPLAQADSATTPLNTAVTVSVLANDSDPDGDSLTVTAVGRPRRGTAAIVGGQIRYTPKTGYVGTDSFTYTVSDGRGGTATATVTITVTR